MLLNVVRHTCGIITQLFSTPPNWSQECTSVSLSLDNWKTKCFLAYWMISNSSNLLYFFQGILSPVYLDGRTLSRWKMYLIPIVNLNEVPKINPIVQAAHSGVITMSSRKKLKPKSGMLSNTYSMFIPVPCCKVQSHSMSEVTFVIKRKQ